MKTASAFPALNAAVYNRGPAPIEFLDTLVSTVRNLPDEVFSESYRSKTEPDVFEFLGYDSTVLVPNLTMRKAFMCEVLRVLGGFESSWNWTEGRDTANADSDTWPEFEAGIFQCSANSMNFDPSLKECLDRHFGGPGRATIGGQNDISRRFITYTKASPSFAIEYCARLLRFTVRHHGPLLRQEIVPWLRPDCIQAFFELLTQTNTPMPAEPATEYPVKKIPYVIDPGHGGADSGAVGYIGGQPYFEKDIVLRVSRDLATLLSRDGRFDVRVTRTTDRFFSLSERAAQANQFGATLVSIHANAGGGTGFECFTTPGQTESDKLATALLAAYARESTGFEGPLPGRYDTKDGDPDKEARFTVLTDTKGPAVLIELGFLDRESDLKLMLEPYFPKLAANALYLGILSYEGLELPKTEAPVEPVKEEDPITVPVDGPPVALPEDLAQAFLEGYEAAIQQLVIREDSTSGVMKKILAGQQVITDLPDYARAWVSAQDARTYLSHPEVRKAAGLPG
jgi:N-acetylmuramoyl-L-alanine amidase